jgi:2'-5' RNA ligase
VTSAGSVEGRERLRLFCALRLPDDVLDRLERWQAEQLGKGRIVPREQLHVTLAFLGSRPAAELEAVAGALREAAAGAGEIVFSALRYRETRSVGMVVLEDEDGRATRMAETVEDGLERLGVYEREARRWLAHVTVLRFRRPPRARPGLPELGRVSPSEVALYHSVLRPTGAQYEILQSVPLGG